MTEDDSMLNHLPSMTPLTLLTPRTGVVPAEPGKCRETGKTNVRTGAPHSCSPSSTPESERVQKLLKSYIQKRLKHQTKVTELSRAIGLTLRVLRTNQGLTLASLASKLNFSFAYLKAVEAGEREASLIHLAKICEYLQHPIYRELLEAKSRQED
jgi:ribosome-binding protein aMBF1 (putative translation factor)